MKKPTVFCLILSLVVLGASSALAAIDEIGALKDNSLFSESGELSNGAGEYTFAGVIALGDLRRALYTFDIGLPGTVTIDNVTLTLNMSRTIVGPQDCSLHRVLSDWGEGASDAPFEEGTGTQAEPGDATWAHTFYPDTFWGTAGGDFDPVASATTSVAGEGFYSWSSAAMVADVVGWIDLPSTNHGWIVLCNEDALPTAKRFDSRENANELVRPVLTIEYTGQGEDGGQDTPAASDIGLVVTTLILLTLGTVGLLRKRSTSTL